jgi:hypothetical protein
VLMQPFADNTLMHVYREPPLHRALKIHNPPANHIVCGLIGSAHH